MIKRLDSERTLFAAVGIFALMGLCASAAIAGIPLPKSHQPALPDYAVFSPAKTNTNIEGVVLACERAEGNPSLQLHVYVRHNERLSLSDRPAARFKALPGASIDIDDQAVPSALLFADQYATIMDHSDWLMPCWEES